MKCSLALAALQALAEFAKGDLLRTEATEDRFDLVGNDERSPRARQSDGKPAVFARKTN